MTKSLLSLFAFLLFLPLLSPAQWSVHEAYGDELEDIQFVDRLNGYAVGRDNGIGSCGPDISAIFRTADGGKTWVRNATDDSYEMTSIHFIDRQNGWASGYFGDSYKTTDCGQTWTRYATNTGQEMQDIFFINEQVGFMVGENGRVLKSGNGGISWSFTYFDTDPDFNCIEFYDEQFGIAVGSQGRIIRTTDQGVNWQDITPPEGFQFLDIEFISATEIMVSGFDIVIKSYDAGLTWETVFFLSTMEGIRAVEFTSPLVGYFGSSYGELWKTLDGGDTWFSLNFPYDEDIYSIQFIDSDLGYISGNAGSIFQTTDGGDTWVSQLSRVRPPLLFGSNNLLTDIHYLSPDTGVCIGYGGSVGITHNAGLTWSRKPVVTHRNLFATRWLDEEHLVAVGDSGTVLRSSDAGAHWTFQEIETDRALLGLWFHSDANTGFTMTDSTLFRTDDAGLNWTSISVPNDYFRAFDFLNPNYGVLVGVDNVHYTYDGGVTWEVSTVIEDIGIPRSVDIVNDTLTFLGASNVLRSINSSLDFDSISTSNQLAAQEIEMINDTLGWLLSSSSPRFTQNGGKTWFSVSTSCLSNNQGYNSLDVVDADHAYVTGAASSVRLWSGERRTRTYAQDSVMCLGEKFNLTYIFKGIRWFGDNTFVAQLSDETGSFDTPTILGTYVNESKNIDPSGVISCQLPIGIPAGSAYRLRVIMLEAEVAAEDNGFDITLSAELEPSISLSQSGGLCDGEEVQFTTSQTQAGTMQVYSWTINALPILHSGNSFQADTLSAGDEVQVSMEIQSSCTNNSVSSQVLTVQAPNIPELVLSDDMSIIQGSSVILTAEGGVTYIWEPATYLDASNIPSPTSTPDSSITYIVTMTDVNGCVDVDSVTITVEPLVDSLEELDLSLKIWPNPSTGILKISRFNIGVDDWNLIDLSGRLVGHGQLIDRETSIDISYLSNGLYILAIENSTYRIAIQR